MIEEYRAIGRRKTSVAQVRMMLGKGKVEVNEKPLKTYFNMENLIRLVERPLLDTNNMGKYDVIVRVKGGGVAGQAGAIRHGIARALVRADINLRGRLKEEGHLTRDDRKKERKKYGRAGARKRFQFSKR
ncbi:MAG: 30S ribosomal protein S9 [Candidatus Aureabacteria bacterium]|nr:30S ribosomal protein S9 [Candidatus Auribacterota bacterium]